MSDTDNKIIDFASVRERRGLSAIRSTENTTKPNIETLLFGSTQQSFMWHQVQDEIKFKSTVATLYKKSFEPALSNQDENALKALLLTVANHDQEGIAYGFKRNSQNEITDILMTEASFTKVREKMVGPDILAAGNLKSTEIENPISEEKLPTIIYTLSYPEPLVRKGANGKIVPTLLGEIIQSSLEECTKKNGTKLIFGQDFGFTTTQEVNAKSPEARSVFINAPAYLSAVQAALQALQGKHR